jgi:glycosyltransferase involved in cell wall biosynthesis
MKVAQIAPLYEAVPPTGYGGTERVVHWLTEELVRQGADVELFASGDSRTSARLVAGCERALRHDGRSKDGLVPHMILVEEVLRRARQFDVIHSHIDYLPFSQFRLLQLPALTTMHGRLDLPELVSVFQEFCEQPVVSISHAQRTPLALANWVGNVYHGLPENLYRFEETPDDYLVFVGRICQEKGSTELFKSPHGPAFILR